MCWPGSLGTSICDEICGFGNLGIQIRDGIRGPSGTLAVWALNPHTVDTFGSLFGLM